MVFFPTHLIIWKAKLSGVINHTCKKIVAAGFSPPFPLKFRSKCPKKGRWNPAFRLICNHREFWDMSDAFERFRTSNKRLFRSLNLSPENIQRETLPTLKMVGKEDKPFLLGFRSWFRSPNTHCWWKISWSNPIAKWCDFTTNLNCFYECWTIKPSTKGARKHQHFLGSWMKWRFSVGLLNQPTNPRISKSANPKWVTKGWWRTHKC